MYSTRLYARPAAAWRDRSSARTCPGGKLGGPCLLSRYAAQQARLPAAPVHACPLPCALHWRVPASRRGTLPARVQGPAPSHRRRPLLTGRAAAVLQAPLFVMPLARAAGRQHSPGPCTGLVGSGCSRAARRDRAPPAARRHATLPGWCAPAGVAQHGGCANILA